MRRVLNLQLVIMLFFVISANAIVLFEIKDENGDPVFVVDSDGLTILNNQDSKALGDTLMTISSKSIKAYISNTGKGLSRSFSVSTSSSKGTGTNLLEVGTDYTTMRESGGNDYTDFSPANIYLGLNAGAATTTGSGNTFMGNSAGLNNTSGNNNVIIGEAAGKFYSGSFGNVFIGQEAAENLRTGQRNVMIGYNAGSEPTVTQEAFGNVFIGSVAGQFLSGDYNVAIGEEAGENYSSYGGSTGDRNVFIGKEAGRNSTGNNNIYIGDGAGKGSYDTANTGSNNIYLGTSAGWAKTDSDRLRIGSLIYGKLSLQRMLVVNGEEADNPNGRTFYVNGTAGGDYAWYNDSDERQKKNIESIDNALDKVLKLRGVTYEWKDENSLEKGRRMGFIAQESVDIIPEAVDYNNETDHYTMQYSTITALLVEAVKELKNEFTSRVASISENNKMIEVQNEKIDNLIKENKELKNKIDELESLRAEIDLIKQQISGYASK